MKGFLSISSKYKITGLTDNIRGFRKDGAQDDIITAINQHKWKWLGHILRLEKTKSGKERLVKQTLRIQFAKGDRLNMLQDIPNVATFEELIKIASYRKRWDSLKPTSSTPRTRAATKQDSKYSLRRPKQVDEKTKAPRIREQYTINNPHTYTYAHTYTHTYN